MASGILQDEEDEDSHHHQGGSRGPNSPKPEDLSLSGNNGNSSGNGEIRVKSEMDFTTSSIGDGDMEPANGDNPLSCLAIVHDEGLEDGSASASSSAMLARLNAAAADHQQHLVGHHVHSHHDQDVDVDVDGEDGEVDVDGVGMGDGKWKLSIFMCPLDFLYSSSLHIIIYLVFFL